MVKFIIEVSEDYIREKKADFNPDEIAGENSGMKLLKMMFDKVAFKAVQKKIDEGQKEFSAEWDSMSEADMGLLDSSLAEICMITVMKNDKKVGAAEPSGV